MKKYTNILKESLSLTCFLGILKLLSNLQTNKSNYLYETLFDIIIFFLVIFIGRIIVVNIKKIQINYYRVFRNYINSK
ncbi:hypothetical protein OW763_13980 [Clostridium aestuarii]|uniref:Uncharacterized protein n=1 Tax=Clostridium aestuarii TaxID=338193 RepID=A0ABT4D2I3_9CLOT|nr:hypothetical protein [Clostridium aestuarii]MCY6485439.1 hypothetical protein [Clostridium aestuarii]